MKEETQTQTLDGLELAGFVAYAGMQGMKYAIPAIIILALSANFIDKLVVAMFKLGGE
tara:strand:- start:2337 stop:2510 length:174 start_codon:yes stop_codon:yes gene_type:complete